MNEQPQMPEIDFTVNKDNLYREEGILDLKVASIRILTPIKLDGSEDDSRKKIYVGNTSIMTPQGPVPLQAELKAASIEEAVDRFPAAMKEATEQMIEKVKAMQQQQMQQQQQQQNDSRIVIPGQ